MGRRPEPIPVPDEYKYLVPDETHRFWIKGEPLGYVIRNGFLKLLEWFVDREPELAVKLKKLGYSEEDACGLAAEAGQLEVLLWLRMGRSRWDETIRGRAIKGGHPKVVFWALVTEPISFSVRYSEFSLVAGKSGDPKMVEAVLHGPSEGLRYNIGLELCFVGAASRGHLDLLKWLKDNHGLPTGIQVRERTCNAAIKGGHLPVLEWMVQNGLDAWPMGSSYHAAKTGRKDLVVFLLEHGHREFGTMTCAGAAESGNLDLLIYLREELGVPWGVDTCSCAVKSGNLDMLKWARDSGCPLTD